MKGYGEYKETGTDYARQIPNHWNVAQLREVFIERKEKNTGRVNKNILSVMKNIGVILYSQKGNVGNKCSEDIERYSIVYEGDIVINSMNIIIGSVGMSRYSGVLSPIYYVLKNRDLVAYSTTYFEFLFRMTELQRELTKYGKGILAHRMRIPMDSFKSLLLPLPPREEQDQIVRYLDAKVGKINKLIRIKQQQIALLKEQKQAIINQAVTKGLDLTVPMKASGIAWIGQIPEGWQVVRLKRILTRPLQYGANEAAQFTNDEWPRYIRITDITADGVLKEETFRSLPYSLAQKYILKYGDILFARSGATVGKTFIYKDSWGKCCFAGYLIKASIDTKKATSEYIKIFTDSGAYKEWVESVNIQATIQNVSAEKYNDLLIPMPPLRQQSEILLFLQTALIPMMKAETFLTRTLATLTEYRTRLISDVVTGKVDVRHICVPDTLPIDIEEDFYAEGTMDDDGTDTLECEA